MFGMGMRPKQDIKRFKAVPSVVCIGSRTVCSYFIGCMCEYRVPVLQDYLVQLKDESIRSSLKEQKPFEV